MRIKNICVFFLYLLKKFDLTKKRESDVLLKLRVYICIEIISIFAYGKFDPNMISKFRYLAERNFVFVTVIQYFWRDGLYCFSILLFIRPSVGVNYIALVLNSSSDLLYESIEFCVKLMNTCGLFLWGSELYMLSFPCQI